MAGLVPAIHVFYVVSKQDVDARDKRGHDEDLVILRRPRERPSRRWAGCDAILRGSLKHAMQERRGARTSSRTNSFGGDDAVE